MEANIEDKESFLPPFCCSVGSYSPSERDLLFGTNVEHKNRGVSEENDVILHGKTAVFEYMTRLGRKGERCNM
jgi:hypothetical protein